MTVGERIKEIRNKTGMSQVDFANKMNVSKQTLYKYENDIITNIPSEKIEAIARIGNVTPAYLMGWDEESQKFENEINGFLLTLKSIGWTYTEAEQCDSENYSYNFSDGRITLKITADEYSKLVKSNQNNLRQELQKLLMKSTTFHAQKHFKPNYLAPIAAHERTDIEVTQEMIDHDDAIMDDDDF